jgi:hypothetical protein
VYVYDVPFIYRVLTVLQHADNAQQAFSSDNVSTLNHAIPALEALYNAWASRVRVEHSKYTPFAAALNVACKTIDTYYEKTTDSPAYIMAMGLARKSLSSDIANNHDLLVLDPREKLGYFKKHWSAQLQLDVKKCVEEVVRLLQISLMLCPLIVLSLRIVGWLCMANQLRRDPLSL